LPVIVTGKPKISTSRRQVLPDIDLRQTRFHIDCVFTCIIFHLSIYRHKGVD